MAQILWRIMTKRIPHVEGVSRQSLEDELGVIAGASGDHEAISTFRIVEDGGIHVLRDNEGRGPSLLISRNGPLDTEIALAIKTEFRRHVRRRARQGQISSYSCPPAWSYDADDLIIGIVESSGIEARLLAPVPNKSRNYTQMQERMRLTGASIGGITEEDGRIAVDTLSMAKGHILAWDNRDGPGIRIMNVSLPEILTTLISGRPLRDVCNHHQLARSHRTTIISAETLTTPEGRDLVLRLTRSRSPVSTIPPEVDRTWLQIEC